MSGERVVDQDRQQVGVGRGLRRNDDRQRLQLRRAAGLQGLEQF
jgi:hypothetical protein